MVLPPHRLSQAAQQKLYEAGVKLAKALNISGPFNCQFIITPQEEVLVIECNVRASRSLPFMSKTLRQDMVEIMGKVLLGEDMSSVRPVDPAKLGYVGVKVPQFSWTRLKKADPRCGVEMASTGEVATFGATAEEAFLKALNSTHVKLPKKKVLFSAKQKDHVEGIAQLCKEFAEMKYEVFATDAVAEALARDGVSCVKASVEEGTLLLKNRQVDYLFCIPSTQTEDREFEKGGHYELRRAAVEYSVPVTTELENARMLGRALAKTETFTLHAWSELPVHA